MATLAERLYAYLESGDTSGHWFFDPRTQGFAWESHRTLATKALERGERLQARGLPRGKVMLIAAGSPRFTLGAFYTAIAAAAKPLIIPTPGAFKGAEAWGERVHQVSKVLDGGLLVAEERPEIRLALENERHFAPIFCSPDLKELDDQSHILRRRCGLLSSAVAFLQMTSGSTGPGKLLAISDANVFVNTRGIRQAGLLGEGETGISWLPLYHDMGLVGAELFCFMHGYRLAMLAPQDFLRRPERWLEAISRFRCTLAVSANFGLDYCVKTLSNSVANHYDLSSLKVLFCGAEPIRRRTLMAFADKFRPLGFDPDAFLPCYGMAETTLASTVRSPADPLGFLSIDRGAVAVGAPAEIAAATTPAEDAESKYLEIVSVGRPIAGTRIEIRDPSGKSLEENRLGEIVVSGPSIALGHLLPDRPTPLAFEGGYVHTGDLGLIYEGELYIIDRMKGIIVHNGVNYSCADMEERVAAIVGAPADQFAVFEADINRENATDVVMFVDGGPNTRKARIEGILPQLAAIEPPLSRVLVGRKRIIPRTTSGKKRYLECRKLLASGQIATLLDVSFGNTVEPMVPGRRHS
ncbi:AMP-binding protein [Candidatus Thiosymbion oneisti]|uniref:AMP-binding protein n=1 Tax=Candidatus Thiosymbion oneisti TaxID=589554 RepID=UPI000B7EFA37|nr:AMP-binding protein [Candidatus Thiosymbion oneisti]